MFAGVENDSFQILRLNTPTISIGGKKLKVGDTFKGNGKINWENSKQSVEVKNLNDGKLYKFSEKLFKSRGIVGSIASYLLVTSKGSSRDVEVLPQVMKNKNGEKFPEKRVALIIGNSNYQNLPFLENAINDASDIADLLEELGFDLIELYDTDYDGMQKGLMSFYNSARNYDASLIYFAGHGVNEARGNYLLPIEAIKDSNQAIAKSVKTADILRRLSFSGPSQNFIFLDLFNDNPENLLQTTDLEPYANRENGKCFVIMTCSPSSVSEEIEEPNGYFAKAVLNNLLSPGDADTVINALVEEIYENSGKNVTPVVIGNMTTDFRFYPFEPESKEE